MTSQDLQYLQIALEIVLIGIGIYLVFFKSYLKEKGKNAALKEDIEDITRMIESVKHELYYSTQSKLSLKNEERNALVNFYEKYNYWLNTCNDVSFAGIHEDNKEKLDEINDQMADARFNFELAKGRMNIYVKNRAISQALMALNRPTLELQHLVIMAIGELKVILLDISHMKDRKATDNHQKLLDKKLEIVKGYYKKMTEKYQEIMPHDKAMREAIYKHLQDLLENDERQN